MIRFGKIIFMKQFICLLFIISSLGFTQQIDNDFATKKIEKSFGKINEGIYMCKTEVSNLEYRTFLSSLIVNNQLELCNASLPDTINADRPYQYQEPMVNFYFRHPAFADYPVIGVTYENALSYCQWLTGEYNNAQKRKFKKVKFRLPTKKEWELAANGGDSTKQYTWGTGFIYNNRKQQLCNYKIDDALYDSVIVKLTPESTNRSARQISKRRYITANVTSYYPSSFGMYNMCGNVAEMILDKGIAKGGSYLDYAWKVSITSERNYTERASDIGFRVLMEVLEK
jgi:formylglycine-generating enzyme